MISAAMRYLSIALLPFLATLAAADPAADFTVRVTEVSINSELDFDAAGKPKRTAHRTQVQCAVVPPAGVTLVGTGKLVIETWTCDDGSTLQAERGNEQMQQVHQESFRHQGYAQTSFRSPQRPSGKMFTEIAGHLTAELATGPAKEATLTPVGKLVGQPVEVEGIAGVTIEIEKWDASEITLGYPREVESRIQTIELRNAQGTKIETHGWSGNGDSHHQSRTFKASVPADGQVVVSFFPEVREVKVPFKLTNIPLPTADNAGKKAPVKIKPTTGADPAKPDQAKVKPTGKEDAAGF